MDGIPVSKEKLSQLASQSQADIERSIDRAGWSPAREAAHAQNMQQLMQRAGQFVKMSSTVRTEATQAKIAAQKQSGPQSKEAPRHNSVARGGYTASQAGAAHRSQGNNSTIRPSIRKHMEQNMRRQARVQRRQQQRQRAVRAVQNAVRSAGRWTARQPQRMVQAISQVRMQRQQHLTHQAREKIMTPSPESQRSPQPKVRQQTAERTAQLDVSQRQTPNRFIQPERSGQQRQQQPKKEQERGPQHTR